MSGLPELTRRRLIIALIVIVLLLGGLYFLLPKLAGLNQTWGQLAHGDPVLLAVAGLLEAISVLGYALLFRSVFGRDTPRIDWRASIEIPLAGIAAIRLLSAAGAGGVAVTAWALRRAGMGGPVIACRMVASYVIQYSFYLGALVICGLGLYFGAFPGGGSFSLLIIPAIVSTCAIILVASMAFLPGDYERRFSRVADRSEGRSGRVAARLATVPDTLGTGVRTALDVVRERPLATIGAAAYWGFDIAALWMSFRAFGESLPVAVVIMGYFIGTLGSLLPLPGGLGGVEGGMIGAFVAFGVPAGKAVIGVLAYRAIAFWLPTIPGIIGYLRLRVTVRSWQLADEQADG
jgi:putative heme transporter